MESIVRETRKGRRWFGECQVIVLGGGPAGIAAATAAARNGARTILVERDQFLGGMMTGGLVLQLRTMRVHQGRRTGNPYEETGYEGDQVIRGIAQEIVDRLVATGGAVGRPGEASGIVRFDPEAMKCVTETLVLEAGAELWLQSLATDVLVEEGQLRGVVVENKSGRHQIRADAIVDATGDGDIAALAGAPFQKGRDEDGRCQPATLVFLMDGVNLERLLQYFADNPDELSAGKAERWKELLAEGKPIQISGLRRLMERARGNGDLLNLGRGIQFRIGTAVRAGKVLPRQTVHNLDMVHDVDGTDAASMTRATVTARKQIVAAVDFLREYVPGYESAYLLQTASQLGVRESRRIIGEYMLTAEDVLEGRQFPDAVARAGRAVNLHSLDANVSGGETWLETRDGRAYDIPYRCLLPLEVENLLVAGRCISVDRPALGSVRGQPVCMATGQAAGVAAALSTNLSIAPRRLDTGLLMRTLVQNGVDLGPARLSSQG